MADGLNHARAMRITEIMNDFRVIQHHIAQIRVQPMREESELFGFRTLRHAISQAQAVLAQPFRANLPAPRGDVEQEKEQLRQVIIDAAVRRFRVHKNYLQATAALRWINSRNAVLGGRSPHAGHAPALQAIDNTLQAELASITNQRVELALRSQDAAQGKWLEEDPSLALILEYIQ
ncbi:hypothetical protein EV356DRAFT_525774 [Viridothelium virens]|uniref:Uncharacterized protein n=1 Tax=Viridothelium virens TaxID=1048519 RepID=A0A6A6H1L2_VIRVR|nr:hypothetical protein EV356DRAFT_525774 [Viridothelium virens]